MVTSTQYVRLPLPPDALSSGTSSPRCVSRTPHKPTRRRGVYTSLQSLVLTLSLSLSLSLSLCVCVCAQKRNNTRPAAPRSVSVLGLTTGGFANGVPNPPLHERTRRSLGVPSSGAPRRGSSPLFLAGLKRHMLVGDRASWKTLEDFPLLFFFACLWPLFWFGRGTDKESVVSVEIPCCPASNLDDGKAEDEGDGRGAWW